jgi:hypothetical protein
LKETLPEINDIMDGDMKEKVAQVWLVAWKASSWEKLNDAPFDPTVPKLVLLSMSGQW